MLDCAYFKQHFTPILCTGFDLCKFDMQFISRLSNASAFAQKLQAEAGNDFIRCPYLANLEIERRKQLQGKGDDDKLIEVLMQYFFRYISTSI